ncbi:MAG: hypothetical protein KGI08_03255, partial [Thaumarchaeota archaeon]|nr:hypothetical protein [Nitrososphaerota archaeon]
YYFHNYTQASLSRLFGLSQERIRQILDGKNETPVQVTLECLLCGNEDCTKFYIDGNDNNNNPQNIIELCEYDSRRIKHMQMRRTKNPLTQLIA